MHVFLRHCPSVASYVLLFIVLCYSYMYYIDLSWTQTCILSPRFGFKLMYFGPCLCVVLEECLSSYEAHDSYIAIKIMLYCVINVTGRMNNTC